MHAGIFQHNDMCTIPKMMLESRLSQLATNIYCSKWETYMEGGLVEAFENVQKNQATALKLMVKVLHEVHRYAATSE